MSELQQVLVWAMKAMLIVGPIVTIAGIWAMAELLRKTRNDKILQEEAERAAGPHELARISRMTHIRGREETGDKNAEGVIQAGDIQPGLRDIDDGLEAINRHIENVLAGDAADNIPLLEIEVLRELESDIAENRPLDEIRAHISKIFERRRP